MKNYDSKKPLDNIKSLLLVDDDRLVLSTLSSGLTRAGYHISAVESVDEAEAWLEQNERPDLVILDVRMPERSGLELTKRLDELHQIPFILLTAYSEQGIITQANVSGAMGYIVKPVDLTQLIPAIETAISRAQERQGLRVTTEQLQIALDADRTSSIAVGIVMDQRQLNHDEALKLLHSMARSQHIKLNELSLKIINAREVLNLTSSV